MYSKFDSRALVSGLPELGQLKFKKSSEIKSSRLSVGFECLDREMFKPEKVYDYLANSGVKWARCQTGWSRCETEKGIYDFEWLDEVVDNMIARNIEPWFNVGYGNLLYMPTAPHKSAVGHVPLYYGEEAIEAWCNYVDALAKHFKGRVKFFEIWNESSHPSFWKPKGVCAEDYTQLVKISWEKITSVIPDAKVVACIASPCEKFIYDSLDAGIDKYISAYSIHPYHDVPEDIYPPQDSDQIKHAFATVPENIHYEGTIKSLRKTFAKKAPHIKIWQGECGCPAETKGHADAGWMHVYNMSEVKQAKWVLRRFFTDFSLGLDMISYFHASDLMEGAYRQADGKPQSGIQLGLIKGLSYKPKLAYYAFSAFCSIFDDSVKTEPLFFRAGMANLSRSESQLGLTAMKVLTFTRNDYPIYVYYLPEDVQMEMATRNDFWFQILNETENTISEPVLVDMVQNKIYDISGYAGKAGQTFDQEFTKLPLTDYPLMITDKKALI